MPKNRLDSQQPKINPSTIIWIVVLVIILICAIGIAGCAYFFYASNKQISSLENILQTSSSTTTTPAVSSTQSSSQSNTGEVDSIMGDWLTYSNQKYGILFKYPPEWSIVENQEDYASLQNMDGSVSFEFRSDLMTNFGLEGFNIDSTENITVLGSSGKKVTFSNNAYNGIYVKFSQTGKDHLAIFYYPKSDSSGTQIFDIIINSMQEMGE